MARSLLLAAFAAVAAFQLVAAEIEKQGDLLILTADNFQEAVEKYNPLLVSFTAPWCGHCKNMKDAYKRAATTIASENLYMGNVDVTANEALGKQFDIQGFPTIKLFRGSVEEDTIVDYSGGRDHDSFVSWMRKKNGPAARTLADVADATKLQSDNEVAYIGFFDAASTAGTTFMSVAQLNDDSVFAITNSNEVRAKFGVAADTEAIVSINKFPGQDNTVVYKGDLTSSKDISAFVANNALPLLIEFTEQTASKIFRGSINTHFLLFHDPSTKAGQNAVDEFRNVAKSVEAGKVLFVTVDNKQDRVLQYFGVKTADMPSAAIVSMGAAAGGQMKKFVFDKATQGAISEESLAKFYQDFSAGTLKVILKSEPIPDADLQAKAPVKTVVNKNFDSLVLDESKDVLVEFYAPWCGHCKNLAPIYEQVGEKFQKAGINNIIIAKTDATANEFDHPNVNVKGFPTILLFKAGNPKEVVEYDGARDVDGFIKFLSEKATNKFNLEAVADDHDEDL